MTLEVKIKLLKFCFAVFNTIFLVLGVSVAGCAVWILFDDGSFMNVILSEELHVVAAGLLVIGGVVVAISVVGCFGAKSEKRFLLLIYLAFLIILLLSQLFITLLLLINGDKIGRGLNTAADQVILQYGNSSDRQDRLMDNVQHYGDCCGKTCPRDWLNNSYIQSLNLQSPDVLPCSCFKSYRRSVNSSWCSEMLNLTEPQHGRGNGTFTEGCGQKLSDWLQENTVTIVAMDVSLMLVQVLQFIITVHLYQAFGKTAFLKRTNLLVGTDHAPDDDPAYRQQNYAYLEADGGLIDRNQMVPYPDDQNQNQVYLSPGQGHQFH
ncbi:CD82 antigen [Embiotoca jacksoni]|uniref:CD82 antigen n=1 Tax=Embiotoca jacksoni TaxID=100190 RepID=UPI003703E71A